MNTERTDKKKVTEAFRALRKKGYIALMNYKCCTGCANASLPDDTTKAVFYNRQSACSFGKKGMLESELYLQWTAPNMDAAEIIDALTRQGLKVQWDGTAGDTVHVIIK